MELDIESRGSTRHFTHFGVPAFQVNFSKILNFRFIRCEIIICELGPFQRLGAIVRLEKLQQKTTIRENYTYGIQETSKGLHTDSNYVHVAYTFTLTSLKPREQICTTTRNTEIKPENCANDKLGKS